MLLVVVAEISFRINNQFFLLHNYHILPAGDAVEAKVVVGAKKI